MPIFLDVFAGFELLAENDAFLKRLAYYFELAVEVLCGDNYDGLLFAENYRTSFTILFC